MFRNQPQHSQRFNCAMEKMADIEDHRIGGKKLRRFFRAPEFGCAKACVLKGKNLESPGPFDIKKSEWAFASHQPTTYGTKNIDETQF